MTQILEKFKFKFTIFFFINIFDKGNGQKTILFYLHYLTDK